MQIIMYCFKINVITHNLHSFAHYIYTLYWRRTIFFCSWPSLGAQFGQTDGKDGLAFAQFLSFCKVLPLNTLEIRCCGTESVKYHKCIKSHLSCSILFYCRLWHLRLYNISPHYILNVKNLGVGGGGGGKLHIKVLYFVSWKMQFFGSFAKLRKRALSFLMSVCPCVNNSDSTAGIFMKIDIWNFFLNLKKRFYIFLTVHPVMILGKWPNWRTILFYVLISILCMFRATSCSSSGESVVSIQRLVYVTLCRWPFGVQVGGLHAKRSPTQSDIYQMLYWYNWFSWWWARGCSKHGENWNNT